MIALEAQYGKDKSKMYGWQKVGNAAGIPRREVEFYETAYRRPNGFPTKLVLDKLGTQGKSVSYLLGLILKALRAA